jgi:SAM-dependent methyltransferase
MSSLAPAGESRAPERLRAHYLIERQLAERLRHAGRTERQRLYCTVYDELFRQVPDHPQLTRKADRSAQEEAVAIRLRLLEPFLRAESVFMEIGAGDCSLSLEVARHVRQVFAVDVSAEITKRQTCPPNFNLIICEGAGIPVPAETVDVAFSYQLVEHLHPIDAGEHVANVYRALAPGGTYVCVTPNRLSGPHDISKYFDTQASGFHMKEYTTWELGALLLNAGFSDVRLLFGARGHFVQLSPCLVRQLEKVLAPLPRRVRRRLADSPVLRQLLGITIVARK